MWITNEFGGLSKIGTELLIFAFLENALADNAAQKELHSAEYKQLTEIEKSSARGSVQ